MPRFFCFGKEEQKAVSSAPPKAKMLKMTMIPRSEIMQAQNGNSPDSQDENIIYEVCSASQREVMLDTLNIMLMQETSHYSCDDYFYENSKNEKIIKLSLPSKDGRGISKKVDISCREQICEWSYRVIDFFNIDREVVYISMSYLDRFLMTCTVDRHTYKLAATTALLLAIKVHHPRKINLSEIISDLSRGEFDMDDIGRMEIILLQSLSWRIHPPTPMNFVIRILMLNPFASKPIQEFDMEGVQDFAIFFVELSVCDYAFVKEKKSTVALAATLNAMEGLGLWSAPRGFHRRSNRSVQRYVMDLCKLVNTTHDSELIIKSRTRLWNLYECSEEFAVHNEVGTEVMDAFTVPEKGRATISRSRDKRKKKSVMPSGRMSSPKSVTQVSSRVSMN